MSTTMTDDSRSNTQKNEREVDNGTIAAKILSDVCHGEWEYP